LAQEHTTPIALGSAVPWPAVSLLNGDLLEPAALARSAVIVVFFSTDCPFCARHNQHVDKLATSLAGRTLRVLGAAQDREPAAVRDYLRRHNLHFEVTMDAKVLRAVLSPRRVIPLTCVVDAQGRLREVIPGEMFEEDVLGLARWART
jgi:peroxiredoxin